MKGTLSVGHLKYDVSTTWVKIGPIVGIMAIAAYFAAATGLLPSRATLVLAFAMGPLLSAAFIGLYHFLKAHRNSAALQAATVFGVIAGTLVNLMLVVQQSLFIGLPSGVRSTMGPAWAGLNLVQLGMDISWDIYGSVAMILLGLALCTHPRFGVILGGTSMVAGLLLLVLNLWSFPIPPGDSGLFDAGPLAGLWFLVLFVRMLFSVKWWINQHIPAESMPEKTAL